MTSLATRNVSVRGIAFAVLAGAGVLGAASCSDKKPDAAPGPSASASATASAAASASAAEAPAADRIQPVYPIDNQPPLPLAERYCNTVRGIPEKRRDACCPSIGVPSPTGECIRTLSSALRSGAVTLDAADLDACAAAVTRETAGCDWVTSVGSPTVAACLGILKGTLKEGARCRSNLECEEGMRCRGLGATRPGKCGPPLPARSICNIATDSLAVFAGQDDYERHHPECAGHCARKHCFDAVAVGAACAASHECGPKARCVAGKCAEGPLPAAGQACTDVCAAGARCSKGKCVALRGEAESCEDDAECRARCERGDGGKTGKCAAQCPSFPAPKAK